jgi:hypothetical protein
VMMGTETIKIWGSIIELNWILSSQETKYSKKNPKGTNNYLVLWAALDKYGYEKYHNCWTGNEVHLKDVDAYDERKGKIVWKRHKLWEKLQKLKKENSQSSWKDILEGYFDSLPKETMENNFPKLISIIEDWERFDAAKEELQEVLGDGRLKAYFIEDESGDIHPLTERLWRQKDAGEHFENTEKDFNPGYKKHIVSEDNFLPKVYLSHYSKKEGTICIKKDDLEKFLSGHKEESPQPLSSDMNAETIIEFLKTKGYVSHFVKIIILFLAGQDGSSDKVELLNWVKNQDFKTLGFSDAEIVKINEALEGGANKFVREIPGIISPGMNKNSKNKTSTLHKKLSI